jgi:hypothetical protein
VLVVAFVMQLQVSNTCCCDWILTSPRSASAASYHQAIRLVLLAGNAALPCNCNSIAHCSHD